MIINSIKQTSNIALQSSFKEKKVPKSYLEAQGTITTDDKTHPLPPQGHLIHDNFSNSVKYFFKDIAYDFKAVKDGFNGTANDHQSGRLNDIGIATAGILIATYLASNTTNPKARIMEYVGLGAFLTAMSLYPKIAINTPAKIMHGYDIDKQYIDDQGRKKSVMQDPNYVPYDMFLAELPEEDLSIIGDKMGVPRDIKNRNEVIREQMRKVATQSNTLWMLTAGVTPALTALLCCGLENYVVAPLVEKGNIQKFDKAIAKALAKTQKMDLDVSSINSNKLSRNVESLLSSYKGQELPKEELNNLLEIFSEDLFDNTAEGIRKDLNNILKNSAKQGKNAYVLTEDSVGDMIKVAQNAITKENKNKLQDLLVPTKEELTTILKRFYPENVKAGVEVSITSEELLEIKKEIKELIDSKISKSNNVPKEFLESQRNQILDNIIKNVKTNESYFVSEEAINKIVNFAKVIGDFKENQNLLTKCKNFNVEFANETIIARSYDKFEKTLLDVLDIKFKDLKKMRESDEYTKKILDQRFAEVAKDEAKFKKAMEKLGNVVSEMEVKLNGGDEAKSRILDLITATENNYNNTAKRLNSLNGFENTINRLVKQNVEELGNSLKSKQELFDFLDGVIESPFRTNPDWNALTNEQRVAYLKANSAGVGSSKNLEISRILERYQGAKNSYNRVLHTFDVYRRALNPESFAKALTEKSPEYKEAILNKAKETLLYASASDHTMKLHTVNNPNFYKDLMYSVWADEGGEFYNTKLKGAISETTKEVLGKNNSLAKGNVLDRFQYYITRFRSLVGNSTVDFTKPHHILNKHIRKSYTMDEKTRMAFFNLVGQTPVDMAKGAASRRYATQKWVRIIAGITGSVFGVALVSQMFFGKLRNPQNLQKQVNNVENK